MPENSNKDEGFVSRWSRRKQQVAKEESEQDISSTAEAAEEVVDPVQLKAEKLEALNKLTDEDMPDIETLNENSDFSGFMSTSVTEGLRKMALKKLFMGASYNIRDGLDEYDGDYTKFEKMPADMVTSDMKHMIGVEAKKQLAKEQEEERQRMIASGELDEDLDGFDESDEVDEFDEFTDEGDDDEVIAEEYVDEHINVEGFDTTVAMDESIDNNIDENTDNNTNDLDNPSGFNNDGEEVA